uniref:Condensin-2 complex subunit H2 C-terminal domain-containing protein n=1 Tax=Cacopsylla melanoneura TaxID=428564 RepID=A0A8D8RE89_9HEMI
MERVNPSFLKLIELNLGKDFASIKDPLSVLLEGFLRNLKDNRYPAANDFSKAGIFIQNAAFIYSMNIDDLFIFVTELHNSLCKISLQPVANASAAPSAPAHIVTVAAAAADNTPADSEESDEQVTTSKSKKQSRKKIEEYDCDPTDIADPWTADSIDEAEEDLVEDQSEFVIDQDLEVETVLSQCDNFENTSSFVHRDDVNSQRSKDLPKRDFRILAPMDDDGFICTDFNIFEEKKSKKYSQMLNTIDLLEGSELTERVNRDVISMEQSSVADDAETRDNNDLDENMETNQNPQKKMDVINRDDEMYDVRKALLYDTRDETFVLPFKCLDEFCKKYVKKNAIYKYELNRTVLCDRLKLTGALNILCGTNKLNSLNPKVGFEGFQSFFPTEQWEWYGWPHTEDSVHVNDNTLELTTTDQVADVEESQFVPEQERVRKPGVEDVHKNVFTKKAARWIEMYKPIVEKTTNRKKFNIREYGDKVMDTMECQTTKESPTELPKKSLEDVLKHQTFQEASKYFLAVLVLANNGNLEIEKPTSDPLTVNMCNIKLLKRERHHDKIDQDIAVNTVPEKKGRKK